MGANDLRPMDQQLYNEVWDYVTSAPQREQAAEQRNKALIRVHEQGWKLVAGALERGLGQIADAIRRHG